jgi:hypothetical protein
MELAAGIWPTPNAGNFNDGEDLASFDARRSRQKAKGINGNGMGDTLAIAASRLASASALWPTPATRDHHAQGATHNPKAQSSSLATMVEKHGSHSAHPVPPTPAGPPSSPERRSLNPLFVEWLMGWPIGWTDCERPVTGFSRWLRRARGALSTLCSPPPARQTGLFDD